jgi:hypothetical protein
MVLGSSLRLWMRRNGQFSRQGWRCALPSLAGCDGVGSPGCCGDGSPDGTWAGLWGLSLKTEEGQGYLAIQRVAWIEVLSLLLGVTAWNLAETSLFPWRPTPSKVNLSRAESSQSDLRKHAMKLSPVTTNGAGLLVLIVLCQDPDLNWAGSGLRPPCTPYVVQLVRL